jgi:hypothetical protein
MRRLGKCTGWVSLAAVSCAVALAACGSSDKPKSTSAGLSATMLNYSECMRSHGVSGFPDPSTSQGPNAFGIDGYNFNLPANMNTQSPAYEAAGKTCQHLISPGSGAAHQMPAKARQFAVAHAQCMRDHGVPNFPDPTFSGNSQGITVTSGSPGINPRSPAFQQAEKTCRSS